MPRKAYAFPRLPLPATGAPLLVLLGLFLFAGNFGHDPWKIEDATHFGVVWRALATGEWGSYRLSSSPIVEPPLYYWAAGIFGRMLSLVIDWPDAVRLTSTFFGALTCLMLYLAARELHGRDAAAAAPLLLIGSLGFLVQSHEAQPMMATLAGLAAVYAGSALTSRRPWLGASLAGAGFAATVLSHGLGFLPSLLATLLAGVATSSDRARSARAAGGALGFALLLSAPWLFWLQANSPGDFAIWWAAEWRQFSAAGATTTNLSRLVELLAWFAWPSLPLAVWSAWSSRRSLRAPAVAFPLAASALTVANVIWIFDSRIIVMALATLPAFALLAVPGAIALRRGAANAFDWFGRMTFTLLAALIWLGWVAMQFGVPAQIARNFAKLAPGFTAVPEPAALIVALMATLLWLWLILGRPEAQAGAAKLRPVVNWAAGLTLVWVLTTTLWLPWIEFGKTYRSVAAAVSQRVPASTRCIQTREVGEAQFASLDYFLTHRLRVEGTRGPECRFLLVQGTQHDAGAGASWRKLWEGARPGDKSERFRLYIRN